MNAEVVAIRHVHFEDLGSFEQVLGERGRRVRYVDVGSSRFEVLDALQPSLFVVLGGPLSVYDDAQYPSIAPLAALVRRRIDAGLPILGICLGAQFIARALGARVYPAAQAELGWAPLTLTDAGRASPMRHLDGAATSMLHWHGDTFDLPGGAIHLASTPVCRHQAFAWGQHVLALQALGAGEPLVAATSGGPVDGLTATEQLVLRFADCLALDLGQVPDEVYDPLRDELGDVAVLELTYITAMYLMQSVMSRALRTEQDA